MTAAAPTSSKRLCFIDTARAVAILLMLEGHFIEVTLADEWRTQGAWLYEVWLRMRGLAAPMFFTVSGVIFAYLLCGSKEPGLWQMRRVRRGLLRAGELFFWGYLLQVNIENMPLFPGAKPDAWLQAFHVLQCIAVALLVMIALFGLLRRAGLGTLAVGYLIAGLIAYLLGVILVNIDGHLPQAAPEWLQNPIKGPQSIFPLAPWLGYTLYGAATGAIVRVMSTNEGGFVSPIPFFVTGLIGYYLGWWLDLFFAGLVLDAAGFAAESRLLPAAFHERIGEILLILGLLVWLEKRHRTAPQWFQTIGRSTFPIYVGHVILLYGGVFGIGLNDWLFQSLNPWQSILGAVIFCGFFGLMAQYLKPFNALCKDLLTRLRERA
jgi:uncharacterized membrane protein